MINLFGKTKFSINEPGPADEAKRMDRLQKMVGRAWEIERKLDKDVPYKLQ